jgi:hypothetical protein
MSEVPQIQASTIVVNDAHRHIINLCQCLVLPECRLWLVNELRGMPFHPDVLATSQEFLGNWEWSEEGTVSCRAALHYFVSQWMGRSGQAGTDNEFSSSLPIRTNANGGDSNRRFRSAVSSLEEWSATMRRCNFSCLEWPEWFTKFHGDTSKHGYYVDPPWVDLGADYRHKFNAHDHRELRDRLNRFETAKIVVRYGDNPLIRELYPETLWRWHKMPSRNQGNNVVDEVSLVNLATPRRGLQCVPGLLGR